MDIMAILAITALGLMALDSSSKPKQDSEPTPEPALDHEESYSKLCALQQQVKRLEKNVEHLQDGQRELRSDLDSLTWKL